MDEDEVIELNVGGTKFTTSRKTLCRATYFAAMFSGRHTAQKMPDGSFFIDRDGRHFHHILNYLRCHGAVVTLPTDALSKEELVVEADFYGIQDLVKAVRMPRVDYAECTPDHIAKQWEAEQFLRNKFCDGTALAMARIDPFHGLIPLFQTPDQEDVPHDMPLKFNPDSETRSNENCLFMASLRGEEVNQGSPNVTMSTLEEFQTNLNRDWPNILHRLGPILSEENVIMAGGSVLRAMTASEGVPC
ncbi:MAG: hypothetical protein SGARI_000663 [Bacillariaceae sp.]